MAYCMGEICSVYNSTRPDHQGYWKNNNIIMMLLAYIHVCTGWYCGPLSKEQGGLPQWGL